MIECVEKFESRQVTTGQQPSVELRYVIRGTNDDVEARSALLAGSPATYDPWGSGWFYLPRDTVTVQPIGDLLWEGIVRYGPVPQTEQSVFNFDTGGGTQHVTHSLATVARYAPPGKTAPDFKGAIGVTADSVEGVDITVSVYHFSETHYLADPLVTPAYKATLFALTGKVNNAAFKGFAAGEVLFLGAAGSKRGSGDWEITYRFAASPNVTNLTIGDITGINKKGWEYLWVRYFDSEDAVAKALVKKPVAVYIEQVYPYGDLNLMGMAKRGARAHSRALGDHFLRCLSMTAIPRTRTADTRSCSPAPPARVPGRPARRACAGTNGFPPASPATR